MYKKNGRHGILLISLILIALGIALSISYIYRLGKRSPLPPFEEFHSLSKQLYRDIHSADMAISHEFFKIGVPQEKIIFLYVTPMREDSYSWELSSIRAMVPDKYSLSQIGMEIKKAVESLNAPMQANIVDISDTVTVCNIFWNGLHTHVLKITLDDDHPKCISSYPKISIIIDDLGYKKMIANELINLNMPLTLSILPFTPYTKFIAQNAHKKNKETMLHLPMEPINYPSMNPGDGVLLESMDEEATLKVLEDDLNQIPFISGVNNHMGSRLTKNEKKMEIVMKELKKRNLYFIDSRTNSDTVAFKVAKKMALNTAKRDVFLDNNLTENSLKSQIEKLLTLAKHRGHAIGIAHPHNETLDILRAYEKKLDDGVRVVPVSDLLN
ncbi:MAG: divergent polysaccharide deacetylase family protein [Deltaproteobacteria bacterium]|nr:divergent polysaccharide deacetylase family protein [Deltaproteobacteria bacterium]